MQHQGIIIALQQQEYFEANVFMQGVTIPNIWRQVKIILSEDCLVFSDVIRMPGHSVRRA